MRLAILLLLLSAATAEARPRRYPFGYYGANGRYPFAYRYNGYRPRYYPIVPTLVDPDLAVEPFGW